MNEYSLTRDDFDTIIELATWPNQKDLMSAIDSKVKAAFTRAYNKESHMNPFSIVNVKKLKGVKLSEEGDELEGDEEEEDHEKDDDVTADAMIKVKKVAAKSAASSSKSTAVKRGAAKTNDEVEKPKSKKTKT
jgi:replication factor C subunit 1